MVVLKELIFYRFLCWKSVVVLKELIFYIYHNFYGLIFYSFYFGVCGGLARTDFLEFLLCDVVVALKELNF